MDNGSLFHAAVCLSLIYHMVFFYFCDAICLTVLHQIGIVVFFVVVKSAMFV